MLSGPFASFPDGVRSWASAAVMRRPHGIGLVSLGELAAVMGQLRQIHSLNVLVKQALAAARCLHADVSLGTESPKLQEALALEYLTVRVHD
jgi:hypothetical protein